MAFLDERNVCGRTILKLCSRGSAIISEVQRLSSHLPAVFIRPEDPDVGRFGQVMFDFRYLKTPELIEKRVAARQELANVDEEVQELHMGIITRFYNVFYSIVQYHADLAQFIKSVMTGHFIQHSLDSVLADMDGRQLMCEAVYLWGVILLLLDEKVPGLSRERLIVAYYRYAGEGSCHNLDAVRKLCAATGYLPAQKRPAGYPEEYFARLPIQANVIHMLLDRLRSDDVYNMKGMFPKPDHRSCALAGQAAMLYIILYFAPDTLQRDKPMMREIVDKHFNDNWVIPIYMGDLADLSQDWASYPAARDALNMDTLTVPTVRRLVDQHLRTFAECEADLAKYLTEGVLTEQFILDNVNVLLNHLRECNVALRWAFLQRATKHKKFSEMLLRDMVTPQRLVQVMLLTAHLEFVLRGIINRLLSNKQTKWNNLKTAVADMMNRLSAAFSGAQVLSVTDVTKDDKLMAWFKNLSEEVSALDYADPTTSGRKVQSMIQALEDVEQFEKIDTSTHIKEFLAAVRENLVNMVRSINVQQNILVIIDTVSNMSYAWELIRDYMPVMHERIKADPTSVTLMRAVFLKLTSVLDVPLVRISQVASDDVVSVAEYYSGELLVIVRDVLEIVPVTVFSILEQVISLQTDGMKALPTKIEVDRLQEYSQLDARFKLAQTTHRISVFTDGIMAMQMTPLGVIEVNPRAILEDGIRKELVRQVCAALHQHLQFDLKRKKDPTAAVQAAMQQLYVRIHGFRRSFEYIQDYINLYGLKIWQEEFARIINFNAEQACNRFLKIPILPSTSRYQSTSIPVPRYKPVDKHVNFMDRTVAVLLQLTNSLTTCYSPESSAWYESSGKEVAGLALMSSLYSSLEAAGLNGIDRILCFRIRRDLREAIESYNTLLKGGAAKTLKALTAELGPAHRLPSSDSVFKSIASNVKKTSSAFLGRMLRVGQQQLLRRQISQQLSFYCRLDSRLLACALQTMNDAVLLDVERHAHNPALPDPSSDGQLLPELASYLEASGQHDPVAKIYVTTEPLPYVGLWCALFIAGIMPDVAYDREFATLTRKRGSDAYDGMPLVMGMATFLRQLHPSVTREFLAYTGQFIRTAVCSTLQGQKSAVLGPSVINTLIFLQQWCHVSHIPHTVLHTYVPSYILDAVVLATSSS